jgi:23S rRNA (uridine2552-2'-O)-methyltransferase
MRLEQAKRDYYRRKAREEGYRSRAAFKLKQINSKYHLISLGHTVVDMGSAPGGWLEVSSEIVGSKGIVIGIDLIPVRPVAPNVKIIQYDITSEEFPSKLKEIIGERKADCVLADLSPKLSGVWDLDQFKQMELCHRVADLLPEVLKAGGSCVMKVFQGKDMESLRNRLRTAFSRLDVSKPDASRKESSEIYMIALGFSGQVARRSSQDAQEERQSEQLLDSSGFVQP